MSQWRRRGTSTRCSGKNRGVGAVDGNPRVDLDLNGLEIFIARCSSDTTPSADHPHQGLDHFGLRVENLDDAAAELKAKGANFTSEPHEIRPGVRIAFVVAPGNIRIELLEKDPNRVGRSRRICGLSAPLQRMCAQRHRRIRLERTCIQISVTTKSRSGGFPSTLTHLTSRRVRVGDS